MAIDFETADQSPDSACAIGLAIIDDGELTKVTHRLIRPPRSQFVFTYIHGITWSDVRSEPTFAEVWQELWPEISDADYLLAHNAAFDRKVLKACCERAGQAAPDIPFICTVKLARAAWSIYPTKLPDVCRQLKITLNHHRADSDAHACAQIAIAALQAAHPLQSGLLGKSRATKRRFGTIQQRSSPRPGPVRHQPVSTTPVSPVHRENDRAALSQETVPPNESSAAGIWFWVVLIIIAIVVISRL
ncbi:MAG: 3'-5' exonuclease [Alphaproteobacteria bacterium]